MMSEDTLSFQHEIVSAFQACNEGKEITFPPDDVSFENCHHRLSQDDIDNATGIALSFLGISGAPTSETLTFNWLMRNYFLRPEFRETLPASCEIESANRQDISLGHNPNWRDMYRIRHWVSWLLRIKGDTLCFTLTEPLFTSGRIDLTDLPFLVSYLEREFMVDFKHISVDEVAIDSIAKMEHVVRMLKRWPQDPESKPHSYA